MIPIMAIGTGRALDTLQPVQACVGWGDLGTGGELGYEDGRVSIGGQARDDALSAHAPSRLLYHLGGEASRFRCRVALNDDAVGDGAYADFAVFADGAEVAHARDVVAGEPPRAIDVDVSGAQLLELVVSSSRFEFAHAVWLEPELEGIFESTAGESFEDALGYAVIQAPPPLPAARWCVATVVSPGFEELLDDMLGSLVANGGCPDARVVVFVLGSSPGCEAVIAKYRALPVRCRPARAPDRGSKAVLYSVARVVDARTYLCVDADTLVLGDLGPLFAASEVCPPGSVLACREGNERDIGDLSRALVEIYDGRASDLEWILDAERQEGSYPLVVNDGVFAGSRSALLGLDGALRAMPGAHSWLCERPDVSWRNQFLFNLALARLDCGVELDATNNIQLHTSEVKVASTATRPEVTWRGRPVRILHVSGSGRDKHPELRDLYASVSDPLAGRGDGDGYGEFLTALRAWVGRMGIAGLEQSFYGTWEQRGGRVRDPSMLPVLALVHYLIRASGCVRVLETGTMRGVSAACLASAVAHRPEGRVVSFDPIEHDGRRELWDLLPSRMRAVIEPRACDSIAGLRAASLDGESYDGALLDSVHTEEHLLGEFEVAVGLVRVGGPILVHDWRADDEMGRAVARIEETGYPVVRLLGSGPVAEDSGLGLALVENRPPAGSEG